MSSRIPLEELAALPNFYFPLPSWSGDVDGVDETAVRFSRNGKWLACIRNQDSHHLLTDYMQRNL